MTFISININDYNNEVCIVLIIVVIRSWRRNVYYTNYSFNVGIARLILIPILQTYLIVWLEQAVQMHLEDLYRDQRIVLSLVVHIHVYLVYGYCSYFIIFRFVFYHWDLDCIFWFCCLWWQWWLRAAAWWLLILWLWHLLYPLSGLLNISLLRRRRRRQWQRAAIAAINYLVIQVFPVSIFPN